MNIISLYISNSSSVVFDCRIAGGDDHDHETARLLLKFSIIILLDLFSRYMPKFCPNCGAAAGTGKFCSSCGTPLHNTDPYADGNTAPAEKDLWYILKY
jgi:hypothetical protein